MHTQREGDAAWINEIKSVGMAFAKRYCYFIALFKITILSELKISGRSAPSRKTDQNLSSQEKLITMYPSYFRFCIYRMGTIDDTEHVCKVLQKASKR